MARTPTLIRPHIAAVRTVLETAVVPSIGTPIPWPIGSWIRPRDPNNANPDAFLRYEDPPFINLRPYPSAADFDGPIDDTQVDITLRIQVQSVGLTDTQAEQVLDLTREVLNDRQALNIPNRRVMDLRLMIVSGGVSRDDDILPAVFYDYDIYELQTTPA